MDLKSADDRQLIEMCRRGDEAAFDTLYQRYRLQLYSYLHKLLSDQKSDVDDLYQQVWMRVLQNLENYYDQQKFISWLFRIAHNLVVDRYRKKYREVSLEEEVVFSEDDPPWCKLASMELDVALGEAVARLPLEQQEVVVLRQQGIPFKDIAVIQKTSINTVLGRMHYAVSKLQNWLSEYV